MNDRQTDVKHKFQNRSARMLPLSAQQHDNGISATGVPTTLLLSSFKVLQVHWNCKAWRSGCPGRLPWLLHSSWALSTSSSFTVLLIHKNCKAWRSGCPGRLPWLLHSSWALSTSSSFTVLLIHKNCKAWRSGCPGRLPWLLHSFKLWAPLLLSSWAPASSFSRCFSSTKTVRLDGVGAQDGYLDFYIASKLWAPLLLSRCFSSTKTVRLIRDGEPGMATLTFTQLLSSESTTRKSLASVPASSKDASQKPGQPAVHASLHAENRSFRLSGQQEPNT